jgi:integrase
MQDERTPAPAARDSRRLVRTNTPGIYRRRNADGTLGQYVVIYRAAGKQRREYADTLDGARRLKREREADRDRGEWQERTTITLRAFLAEWVETYQGNGRTGFRENTRAEYRRLLDAYAHRYFGERLRLVDVTPRHMALWVSHLADEVKQGRTLSDSTIRNIVMPVRAALADAKRQGMIRHNPADGLVFPKRARVEEDEDDHVRALDPSQLGTVLAIVHPRHRLLVQLVAATGLRVSEAIALQRRHLKLDGERPHLLVRRAIVRGRVEPPKTRHGRRAVRLPHGVVVALRAHLSELEGGPDALVFPSQAGTPLDPDNLRSRILKPAAEEAGVAWAGWHSLRHTFASLQLARGTNLLQLSRALGHHSPAFTLERYCHLLPGGEAEPLDLEEFGLGQPVVSVATSASSTTSSGPVPAGALSHATNH